MLPTIIGSLVSTIEAFDTDLHIEGSYKTWSVLVLQILDGAAPTSSKAIIHWTCRTLCVLACLGEPGITAKRVK
jgi:hypothetical protein